MKVSTFQPKKRDEGETHNDGDLLSDKKSSSEMRRCDLKRCRVQREVLRSIQREELTSEM